MCVALLQRRRGSPCALAAPGAAAPPAIVMNFKPDPSWGITGTHDCSSLNASFLCCGAAKDVLTAKSLKLLARGSTVAATKPVTESITYVPRASKSCRWPTSVCLSVSTLCQKPCAPPSMIGALGAEDQGLRPLGHGHRCGLDYFPNAPSYKIRATLWEDCNRPAQIAGCGIACVTRFTNRLPPSC